MIKTRTAGGVVVSQDGKILVVNQNGNSWSLPKGHIDPGENARGAAVREIEEESGIIQLAFIKNLGAYKRFRIGKNGGEDSSNLKTIEMFLYSTNQSELQPIDPGNPEAIWVEPDAVGDLLTHPRDKEFFNGVLPIVKDFIASR